MIKKILFFVVSITCLVLSQSKISVITTLFPLYDFAKIIGGMEAEVVLILPPAVEPHSFEPTPKDMIKISKANLLIFTNEAMEPWISSIAKNFRDKTTLVESGKGILHEVKGYYGKHHKHHHDESDPHVWLDPIFALKIIDNITSAYIQKAPRYAASFRKRANLLKASITKLHENIQETLGACKNKKIIYAGHFAFGHFAKRYDIHYETTYHGFSPDAEPSPKRIAEIIKTIKENNLNVIYYEALTEPRIAKTISKETGARMLLLHSAANISKNEMKSGKSYISIMKSNLKNLQKGISCE